MSHFKNSVQTLYSKSIIFLFLAILTKADWEEQSTKIITDRIPKECLSVCQFTVGRESWAGLGCRLPPPHSPILPCPLPTVPPPPLRHGRYLGLTCFYEKFNVSVNIVHYDKLSITIGLTNQRINNTHLKK